VKFNKLYIVFLLVIPVQANTADIPFDFSNTAQEQQYKQLIEELRCLVCQNQSLADSSADLAQDLRNEIFQMIVDGKSDKEIINFLVARYGDFVLYKPPLNPSTLLLWFGPFILLIAAVFTAIIIVRRRKEMVSPVLTEEEKNRINELVNPSSKGK